MTPTPLVTVIVPFKGGWDAKSRLSASPQVRHDLAQAFVADVAVAALAARRVAEVVVVTGDSSAAQRLRRLGCTVLDEPAGPSAGLNQAVALGRAWAADRRPSQPLVVLPSDLPGLTPDDLDAFVADCAGWRLAFVADAEGGGTTALFAADPEALRSAYGPDSAGHHAALGAERRVSGPRLSHDVDTWDDLAVVAPWGLGDATTAAVAAHAPHLLDALLPAH